MSENATYPNDGAQGNVQSRIKQIMFGKNTDGYQRYLMLIPKEKRRPNDPQTPDPYEDTSKRRFEGKAYSTPPAHP
ncbi:Histone hairpin binding protein [Blastocystis sp. ATCC 50177/Nand II]|uniref:Histone hairpin binding protein n=1 Tax=Blastocystis sp. subtype 1 (strain ATCC 50177 / NandII) TaxID=478820 RepID=A0A196S623_BLAHN|nr:Histone hairpin binding protein [Blastocystis sp. ATCC 50177/Nand II]